MGTLKIIALIPPKVGEILLQACRADVAALKPGNVSFYAPGHGMEAKDFITAAEAAVPWLVKSNLKLGERLEKAANASFSASGNNTNLGILLLLAPLAAAAINASPKKDLRQRLKPVLNNLTLADAEAVYRAIRKVNPGGLGKAKQQDVTLAPQVTLLEAMRLAQGWDRVARQYTSDYEDVFTVAVPALKEAFDRGFSEEWAVVNCYLTLLTHIPDTHVMRKQGADAAMQLKKFMQKVASEFKACENPLAAAASLLRIDEKMKRGKINPGTTADLTVAALAAVRLQSFLATAA
jgi:triphosphoribosyl-dephospho-CoA synthase